ncbi:ABC transporter ATP-binding protein [Candidatus Dependentiae bacterium]|nr:ABC transporter ATP-binding protein [Candidatus Dependentiae bacterium]
MISASVFEGLGLLSLAPIIDSLIYQNSIYASSNKIIRYTSELFLRFNIKYSLFYLLFFFLLIFVIKKIIDFFCLYLQAELRRDLVADFGGKIYNNLMEISYSYYHASKKGELIYYISGSAMHAGHALIHCINLLISLLMISVYFIVLSMVSLKLSLLILVMSGISIAIYKNRIKKSFVYSKESALKNQKLNSMFIETIDGIKIIKAYMREEYEKIKFKHHLFDYLNANFKSSVNTGKMRLLKSPVTMFLVAGMIYVSKKYFNMSFSEMGLFFIVAYRFIPAFQGIADSLDLLSSTLPPVSIGLNVISSENKPYILDGNKNVRSFDSEIKFEKVSYEYIKGNLVINNMSFIVPKQKTTAIIGATGSGKSTIIDLIMRFYDPASGVISVDGTDLKNLKLAEWRNLISVVLQDNFIFNASVKENILYGKLDADEGEILNAAKNANAYDFIMKLPDKFDTVLGERGITLSGGQKQMIALARALVRKPQILILDEATSSLDNESERLIQNSIEKLSKNITVIVIAHRLSTILNADQIIVIDNGKIVETGNHAELISKNGKYKKYYDLQFSRLDHQI